MKKEGRRDRNEGQMCKQEKNCEEKTNGEREKRKKENN